MTTTALIIILIVLVSINIWLNLSKKANKQNEELKEKLIQINSELLKIAPLIREEFSRNRNESQNDFKNNREELNNSFKFLGDELTKAVANLSNAQKNQFDIFSTQLSNLIQLFEQKMKDIQEQLNQSAKENRGELSNSLKSFEEKFSQNVREFNDLQKQKFDDLINRQNEIRKEIESKLKEIQENNNNKLEEMRKTVDEKLQESVEKRFNESFKLISNRLDQVHQGLGEMQKLATGVGDLKRVLTNVKTRGIFGEIQLGTILEQILSPNQYEKNAQVKEGSQERVDYVIKLPEKNDDNSHLLLPIDSKFPIEDYERLMAAYDKNDPDEIDAAGKQLESSVKKIAKDIQTKYINPPITTDFAIMFVPTEGLYAEIVRRIELFNNLQQQKIIVVGPTNLVAFLSSLQMGFRTLTIQKKSNEIWKILNQVKTDFGKFGDLLDKTKDKLEQAVKTIDDASKKSQTIQKKLEKLEDVQELPQDTTTPLLTDGLTENEQEGDE